MEIGEKVLFDLKVKVKGFLNFLKFRDVVFFFFFYGGFVYVFEKYVFDFIRRDCCFGNLI